MIYLKNFFVYCLIFNIFLVFAQSKFLNFGKIGPNLIMIGLIFLIFRKENFKFILLVSSGILISTSIFLSFWLSQMAILIGLIILMSYFKKFLTGNNLSDFLILLFFITLIFNFLLAQPNLGEIFSLKSVAFELLYNLIMGLVIWFLSSKIIKQEPEYILTHI